MALALSWPLNCDSQVTGVIPPPEPVARPRYLSVTAYALDRSPPGSVEKVHRAIGLHQDIKVLVAEIQALDTQISAARTEAAACLEEAGILQRVAGLRSVEEVLGAGEPETGKPVVAGSAGSPYCSPAEFSEYFQISPRRLSDLLKDTLVCGEDYTRNGRNYVIHRERAAARLMAAGKGGGNQPAPAVTDPGNPSPWNPSAPAPTAQPRIKPSKGASELDLNRLAAAQLAKTRRPK